MKDENNKKNLFVLFIKFIVFVICLLIIWRILVLIRPYIVQVFSESTDGDYTLIERIISAFLGFFDLIISVMTTSFIESIFMAKQDLPRVFLYSPQGRAQNVSGIKTMNTCNSRLCVEIGIKQSKFRIVYARIQNTGKRTISECSINGQMINIMLPPNQSSELYFIIYTTDEFPQTDGNIEFPYCIRDDQGNTYMGKYTMKVNYGKSIATFHPIKKMKRSILKDALSNL